MLTSAFEKLMLGQRFLLLGVLGVLLVAPPLYLYIAESNKVIDFSLTEQEGLKPGAAVLTLLDQVQQHRGLSAGFLSGKELGTERAAKKADADKAFKQVEAAFKSDDQAGAAALAKARGDWESFSKAVEERRVSPAESFATHTALCIDLLNLIEHVADKYGLSLDPDIDSYYLMRAVFFDMPQLTEALGQVRGKGTGLLAGKQIDAVSRASMHALVARTIFVHQQLQRAYQKAFDATPDLKEKLGAGTGAAAGLVTQGVELARANIADAETLSYSPRDYFSTLTKSLDAQFKTNLAVMEQLDRVIGIRIEKQRSARNILAGSVAVVAFLAVMLGWVIARSIRNPLGRALRIAKAVADGDLTQRIEISPGKSEFAQLLSAMGAMQQRLNGLVLQIKEATEAINTASSEIVTGSSDLARRTEGQASSLEETTASMEQVAGTVKQTAGNAKQANDLVKGASLIAKKGGKVANEVVDTMASISGSSKKIVDIISLIDSIAFQTNILALNAAVEAARAGEQGRGFAVVATEVRSLSQRTAVAAKEIKELISESAGKIDAGARLVGEASATMDEIVVSIDKVTNIIAEIASASQEESLGIEQVTKAATQMEEITQQNAALVEQTLAASESLEQQARKLAGAVAVFKLTEGEGGAHHQPEQAQDQGELSPENIVSLQEFKHTHLRAGPAYRALGHGKRGPGQ